MDCALQRTLRCAQLFPDASSPAGVSFKSHVRDVAPRLMSVFNFTTSDFGQVSTFDWTIHLEPALNTFLFLKLFVVLLKQCRVELLQLWLWRLSQLGRRRRNGLGPRSHYLLLFPRNTRCTDWTHSPHSALIEHTNSKHTYVHILNTHDTQDAPQEHTEQAHDAAQMQKHTRRIDVGIRCANTRCGDGIRHALLWENAKKGGGVRWGLDMGLNAVDNLPSFALEGHSRHCPRIAMICVRGYQAFINV